MNEIQHFLGMEGPDEEAIGIEGQGIVRIISLHGDAGDDNGDMAGAGVVFQGCTNLSTRHLGHRVVENDDVRYMGFGHLEFLDSRCWQVATTGSHVVKRPYQEQDALIVINNQKRLQKFAFFIWRIQLAIDGAVQSINSSNGGQCLGDNREGNAVQIQKIGESKDGYSNLYRLL